MNHTVAMGGYPPRDMTQNVTECVLILAIVVALVGPPATAIIYDLPWWAHCLAWLPWVGFSWLSWNMIVRWPRNEGR